MTSRLNELRVQNCISQAQLAENIGVGRKTIARIEAGGGCGLFTAIKIANFFMVTLDDLWGDLQKTDIRIVDVVS